MDLIQVGGDNLVIYPDSFQGIIAPTGTETLQRNLSLQDYCGSKVNARAVSLEMFTGFSRMSVTASLLCFGCFAAG